MVEVAVGNPQVIWCSQPSHLVKIAWAGKSATVYFDATVLTVYDQRRVAHRKVNRPSSKATSRWLEIATRCV